MKKIIRNILKGMSLTAALFVFQACYGTPQASRVEDEDEIAGEEALSLAEESLEVKASQVAVSPEEVSSEVKDAPGGAADKR